MLLSFLNNLIEQLKTISFEITEHIHIVNDFPCFSDNRLCIHISRQIFAVVCLKLKVFVQKSKTFNRKEKGTTFAGYSKCLQLFREENVVSMFMLVSCWY